MKKDWNYYSRVNIPDWLVSRQSEFQSKIYPDDESKMSLVFECAKTNALQKIGAPLAAAVFLQDGTLVSIGVDAPGMGGHEMTNALLLASNIKSPQWFNDRKVEWEFFSLAPPCSICLGHIYGLRPHRFVCSVTFEDLLSTYQFPNTPFPDKNWNKQLTQRSVCVEELFKRLEGLSILQSSQL